MVGLLLHVNFSANCPHGGQVSANSSNSKVLVGGQPVATLNDNFTVMGCSFFVGSKAQPCVKVQWVTAATRVMVNGQPAILQTDTGICQSAEQIPQGPPNIVSSQTKVMGA